MQNKFLNLLVAEAGIPQDKVVEILKKRKGSDLFIPQIFLEEFPDNLDEIIKVYCTVYKSQVADLSQKDIPRDIIALIPREVATQNNIVPIDRAGNNIIIAVV